MNRVLLVSNVSRDDAGGRAEKFDRRATLLDEMGWDVTVSAVKTPWQIVGTMWSARQLAKRGELDVVNTVNNPLHLHLVGFVLSLLYGVPWVAEYRDPLVQVPDRTLLTKPLAYVVERLVVLRADRILWWDGIQLSDDYFGSQYGITDRVRKTPVGAGFDSEAFRGAESDERDEFIVTYAGSFYEGWIEPYSFLEAIQVYREEYDTPIRVRFFGEWSDDYDRRTVELGIDEIVKYEGFVPHDEVVPALKGADALLYLGGTDERNERNVPSKVMDYIGARNPILAVTDESFRVARLVEGYSLGVAVSPEDPMAIAEALESIRTGESTYSPSERTVERFSRRHRVEFLRDVLEEVNK